MRPLGVAAEPMGARGGEEGAGAALLPPGGCGSCSPPPRRGDGGEAVADSLSRDAERPLPGGPAPGRGALPWQRARGLRPTGAWCGLHRAGPGGAGAGAGGRALPPRCELGRALPGPSPRTPISCPVTAHGHPAPPPGSRRFVRSQSLTEFAINQLTPALPPPPGSISGVQERSGRRGAAGSSPRRAWPRAPGWCRGDLGPAGAQGTATGGGPCTRHRGRQKPCGSWALQEARSGPSTGCVPVPGRNKGSGAGS